MKISTREMTGVTAEKVSVTDESLVVELFDGRVLSVPLAWYPRLMNGSKGERNDWRLIGRGVGIHWPELDEDLSVDGLLRGTKSGESSASFSRWLAVRRNGGAVKKGRSQPASVKRYPLPGESKGVRRVAEREEDYGEAKI